MAVSAPSTPAASFGWQSEEPIYDWLFAEGYRFEFFQAVRLLEFFAEAAGAPAKSLGEGSDPEREAVRLRAKVGFDFPASEVGTIAPPSNESPQPELTANFFSLAGASAPLPDWVAELLQFQLKNHDPGLRDFLDIFHHRLLSLLYRVRLRHRLWLEWKPLEESRQAGYILSFAGLGLAELRGRMDVADGDLLPYAGLLWQRPRSVIGLERILADMFAASVSVLQMVGVWRRIEPEDWTRIGSTGQNQRLGKSVVLGRRVWDSQGGFEIVLGPLTLAQFKAFLPIGRSYERLQSVVRFYAGRLFAAKVRLLLAAGEVPRTKLGRSRLGWTSWLRVSVGKEAKAVRLGLF